MAFLRGRSLPNQFIVIDDAQNLTPHEMKTVISRVGKGSKIVVTGDPYQIDNPYLDASSTGLANLVEKFKGQTGLRPHDLLQDRTLDPGRACFGIAIRAHRGAPYIFILLILSRNLPPFHALDRQSLWDDEMSTLRTISMPGQMIQSFATYETHPPLYFLQLRIWRALAFRSLVKLRANSALWGSLSLFLMYLLGRCYGGETLGRRRLGLLAVPRSSCLQPGCAHTLVIIIATVGVVRPLKCHFGELLLMSPRRRSWPLNKDWVPGFRRMMAVTLLWTALLYTHYWGAFIVLAQSLWICLFDPGERRTILRIIFAASLAFALWLPVLAAKLGIVDRLVSGLPFFSRESGQSFLAYGGLVFNHASSVFYLPVGCGSW